MAISKQQKQELVTQYADWMTNSQAFILTEYSGLTVKDLDELRKNAREVGGEFHIVKNTLSKVAFEKVGLSIPENVFLESTAMAFAFEDAPGMAKVIVDLSKESDFMKIKCGYMDMEMLTSEEIRALAELPPLPVLQAKLLSTILAPASNLSRVITEPARQVSTVIQAYADRKEVPAVA